MERPAETEYLHLKRSGRTGTAWAAHRRASPPPPPPRRLLQQPAYFSTACRKVLKAVPKPRQESVGLILFQSKAVLSESPMLTGSWVPGRSEWDGGAIYF